LSNKPQFLVIVDHELRKKAIIERVPKEKPSYPPPSAKFISLVQEIIKTSAENPKKKIPECPVCHKEVPTGNIDLHIENEHTKIIKEVFQPSASFLALCEDFKKNQNCDTPVRIKKPQIPLNSCNICFKDLGSESRAEHMEKEHPDKVKDFPQPTESFVSLCTEFKEKKIGVPHIKAPDVKIKKIFHIRKAVRCRICLKDLGDSNRTLHEQNAHRPPYKCEICLKTFKQSINALVRHRRVIHLGISNFSCKFCGKCVGSKRNLIDHEITHTGERPYVCPLCGKTFTCSGSLNTHQYVVHDNVERFFCHVCGFGTPAMRLLRVHIKQHFKERSFICHICGSSFFSNSHLQRHILIHEDNGKRRRRRRSIKEDEVFLH